MLLLNERIFHNNGKPVTVPLRSAFAGTNKLNADADMAALWDRLHLRFQVGYVSDRDQMQSLFEAAIQRQSLNYVQPEFTTVSLTELDEAYETAMTLPIGDLAYTTFLDLIEELGRKGVLVSTRRQVEGLKAVLATAYIAGHDEVKVGDFSILRHMFWSRQEKISEVKNVILTACNPGEKQALDLLDDLDKLKTDYANASNLDDIKRNTAAIDIFKKAHKLMEMGSPLLETATLAGAGTQRITDLIDSANALRVKIGKECFNLTEENINNMPGSGRR